MSTLEEKQNQYLFEIEQAIKDANELEEKHQQEKKEAWGVVARKIEEAKLEAEVSVKMVADRFGKSRQAINNILIAHFGIRYPDKSKAAFIRHQQAKDKVE